MRAGDGVRVEVGMAGIEDGLVLWFGGCNKIEAARGASGCDPGSIPLSNNT